MPNRRILSIWFPRLAAERHIRRDPNLAEMPFAVVKDVGQAQVLASLSIGAQAAGLYEGQPLRDAHAMCADLLTRLSNPHAEAAFLGVLHRWAGKFSPWVAREEPDALVIDLTGCSHLFGGEEPLAAQIEADCEQLGLSVQLGIADTLGGAWALARFGGQQGGGPHNRNGDAIDQEARATRSRAGKRRHWERGGAAPVMFAPPAQARVRIAAPGQTHSALAPLPIAALRLEDHTNAQLARLGLRRVQDVIGQPRAALVRRFGRGLVARLDQAMGSLPEPVSPAVPPDRFATRLSLPDPIGLEDDVMAALDRMLPRLCAALRNKGRGARTLRLEAYRSDSTMQWMNVTLAKPSDDIDRMRPLLRMKVEDLDAGFGIDMLRLEAVVHEPLHLRTKVGHLEAAAAVQARLEAGDALEDLIGRLGTRLGMEAITRVHPADSHIPEKTSVTLAAAWSKPAGAWPDRGRRRPLLMWRPEPVMAPDIPRLAKAFRWRGRQHEVAHLSGPERIAPEWWLDDPNWRSGQRDYWEVVTKTGHRLWLFYAHGALMSSGWFCQGEFA
ncbi:DNA polymerase Y family protein [Marivita sp. S6314]|uniref:DNA polymerase Y family protein n=1 Tax=Marivita sp. S6314 TaxID=2926406 RepID=UPI001FF636D9|nr:DNA polymerase Y family protein [Marivita sp. S6314]MCK0150289.1 DNA polymerase Y family protein [Marivita sp. S6314]